ncbi:MAG: STAS-like domain-containing protein [Candidatus Wildermuthbacteria bacterium]|nr:STAS-like domain-containing protein [Candidatus Wildermuthbacteria bacterium]
MITTILLKKFGAMLISRPAGREAWLAAQAYSLSPQTHSVVVDFDGVEVLSPSWADEFLTPLRERYGAGNVRIKNTENPSVRATLEVLHI